MSKLTYTDFLSNFVKLMSAMTKLEQDLKKYDPDFQISVYQRCGIGYDTINYGRKILSTYNLTTKEVMELEQLLGLISNNKRVQKAKVLYSGISKAIINTNSTIRVVGENIKENELNIIKHPKKENLYQFMLNCSINYLKQENTKLNLELLAEIFEQGEPTKEILEKYNLNSDVLVIEKRFSLEEMQSLFDKYSPLLKSIINSKNKIEKEYLKTDSSFHGHWFTLDENKEKSFQELYMNLLLEPSNDNSMKINELDKISNSLATGFKIKLKNKVLLASEEIFFKYLDNLENIEDEDRNIDTVSSKIRYLLLNFNKPTYKNVNMMEKVFLENEKNFKQQISLIEENTSLNNKQKEIEKKLILEKIKVLKDRYDRYLLRKIELDKTGCDKYLLIDILNFIGEDKKQELKNLFPDIFVEKEKSDWLLIHTDRDLIKIKLKDDFFIYNEVSAKDKNISNAFEILNNIDNHLFSEVITSDKNGDLIIYAEQNDTFKKLNEKQKRDVVLSFFDLIAEYLKNIKKNELLSAKVKLIDEIKELSMYTMLATIDKSDNKTSTKLKI